jgi:anti-sigma-K factor RskA
MSATAHDRHRDDVGVYLLGALAEDETRAFEEHLKTCHVCRDELERLQTAADMLPHGVSQYEAPPRVKAEVMAAVAAEADADAKFAARGRREPRRAGWRRRPRVALAVAAAIAAIAVASGIGIAELASESEAPRTLAATIDRDRLGDATAKLTVDDDGSDGATLEVAGFPDLGPDRTYMAWVARGARMSPQPTFDVDRTGSGTVVLPADLRDVDAVLVTRERRGGAPAPSEPPLLRVDL